MDVRDLLPEHLLALNHLRVRELLPDLVGTLGLILLLEVLELIQQPLPPALPRRRQDLAGGVPLDGLNRRDEIRPGRDEVQMVLHDDVGVHPKALLPAAVGEGVHDALAFPRPREDRQPLDDGGVRK